jgi:hypothetical protein
LVRVEADIQQQDTGRLTVRGKAIVGKIRLGWDRNFARDVAGIVKEGNLVYFQADVTQWTNSRGRRPPENSTELLDEDELVTCVHILTSAPKTSCIALVLRPSRVTRGVYHRVGLKYEGCEHDESSKDTQLEWFGKADLETFITE